MDWYMMVLRRYFEFDGRSQRAEYWFFALFNLVIGFILGIVDGVIGTGGLLGMVYMLAILVPSVAVSIRRLHDTGRSGWWLLVSFVPIVGVIALIIFFVQDSQNGPNAYGADPKRVPVTA